MTNLLLLAALLVGVGQASSETLTLNDIKVYDAKSGKLYPTKTTFRDKDLVVAGRQGFEDAECSWILATNEAMNRSIRDACGGHIFKTYRVYERSLLRV